MAVRARFGRRQISLALVFGVLAIPALASTAAAQSKLPSGFYYPVNTYWPVSCSAYLERDAANRLTPVVGTAEVLRDKSRRHRSNRSYP